MTEVGFHSRFIPLRDGLKVHVRDYPGPEHPALPPLLCLTGLVRNSVDYHELALRHADQRRVLAVDYPGRGLSDWAKRWERYKPFVLVRDLLELIDGLGLTRYAIVGSSLGGIMAMAISTLRRKSVSGVVLNDIGPVIEGRARERIAAYVGDPTPMADWPAAMEHAKRIFSHLPRRPARFWEKLVRGGYVRGSDGQLRPAWDPAIAKTLGVSTWLEILMWQLFKRLRGIPTLAFRGMESDLLSPPTFMKMRRTHPEMVAVEVPGAGHTPMLDEPEAQKVLDDFLARH